MHKHDFAFYRPRLDDFLLSQPTETPWEVEGAARLFLHVLCTFSKVEEILWRCYSQRSRIREKSSYIVLSFLETLLASSNFPPSPPPASPFFLLLLVLQFSSLPFFSPAFLSAAASAPSSSSPFSSAVLLFADVALVSWGRTGKVGRRRREGGRGRFEMEKFFFSLRSADWSLSRRRTWAQAGFARFPPFRSDDQRKNPLPRQTCVSREQILYNVLTALSLDFFFTCGRRPAGHVMMSVVGVVGVVVVVVVVVVGGEQLLYMGSPRAHVWSYRIQKQNPFFV